MPSLGIGDDQLDAAQTAPGQPAQELRPDRLDLGGADLHAQHLAAAIGIGPAVPVRDPKCVSAADVSLPDAGTDELDSLGCGKHARPVAPTIG